MKFKYDGKSRPSNKAYDENWDRIFGKKEVKNDNRQGRKRNAQVVQQTGQKKHG